MNINSKIENIKSCFPQMGLVDRFFYLINELYQNYFDDHNEYYKRGFEEEKSYEWNEEDKAWELYRTEGIKEFREEESLNDKFLQEFGNSELKDFILLEIKKLNSIFWKKYSFELSFLHDPYPTKNYYLSGNSDFLLLSPFFYDFKSLKDAIRHELIISDIDDRPYLLSKYQGILSEIKYRINNSTAWDAGLENERFLVAGESVFPERKTTNLNQILSFVLELQKASQEELPNYLLENNRKEKLEISGINPNIIVNLFLKVLNRKANEENLIQNFVSNALLFDLEKYVFNHEITDGVLELKNKEETFKICQTLALLIKLKHVKNKGASFTLRVLISSLKKNNKNKRVWLSDNLRNEITSMIIANGEDLSKAIGFSSKEEFILFLTSS